jgi:nucleoside-triphosphatase
VNALLLTGAPGIGKTTILRKVVANLPPTTLRGFLTDEIREGNERVGFRLAPFKGDAALLAHTDSSSPHRVGRYRVEVAALERIVESALIPTDDRALFIVDEIGKMECLSPRFVEAVTGLLDSRRLMVATVARKGGGFIEEVKGRSDVELWEVTRKNRDRMASDVLSWLEARL